MMGGDLHTRNVEKIVDKLATIISLFLASTKFYGKRLDLYSNKLPAYVDKSQSKLKVVFIKNVPQQDPSSNTTVKATPQSCENMEEARTLIAKLVRVK
ncbi:hypothetical protein H5410_041322 [Solanum commersonii]|uniref:Uncharacterized protein n=1 Tax=Solanum commersonii TaxID=4109 RepID=A0A9J5XUF5_SOLCO|nr:hypothetical protein H5410_041322 [Solanum commersonii]